MGQGMQGQGSSDHNSSSNNNANAPSTADQQRDSQSAINDHSYEPPTYHIEKNDISTQRFSINDDGATEN